VKSCAHNADASLDSMLACADTSHVRKRSDKANRAVAAHVEVAHVIEEDHARCATSIIRFAEKRPDEHVRTTRFINDGGPKAIMPLSKDFHTLPQRTIAQIRAPLDDDARRLSSSVGIDDSDLLHQL